MCVCACVGTKKYFFLQSCSSCSELLHFRDLDIAFIFSYRKSTQNLIQSDAVFVINSCQCLKWLLYVVDWTCHCPVRSNHILLNTVMSSVSNEEMLMEIAQAAYMIFLFKESSD